MITIPTTTARAIEAIAARALAGQPPHANAITIAWRPNAAVATAIGAGAEARIELPGLGWDSGIITLPGGALGRVAAVVDAPELSIAADGPAIVITAGTDRWQLVAGPDADDLSPWREPAGHAVTLPAPALTRAIAIAASAASRKDHRRQLMGVRIAVESGRVTIVGTDGKRLERLRIAAEPQADAGATATRAWCDALAALKPAGPAELRIDAAGDLSLTTAMPWGRVTLRTRGEPGKYPDVDQVIPRDPTLSFDADVAPMLAAVRRAAIAEPDAGGVLLTVGEDRRATVSAACADVGEASDAFGLAGFDAGAGAAPPPWSIAFSSHYLTEALATYSGRVRFRGTSPASPWLIDGAGDAGVERLTLVMPIRKEGRK